MLLLVILSLRRKTLFNQSKYTLYWFEYFDMVPRYPQCPWPVERGWSRENRGPVCPMTVSVKQRPKLYISSPAVMTSLHK